MSHAQRWGRVRRGAVFVLIASGCSQQAPARPPRVDGLALFASLLPALHHPRCAGCHGDVDPFSGRNHPAGVVAKVPGLPGAGCAECHDEASTQPPLHASGRAAARQVNSAWRLPFPEHAFAGQSAATICGQFHRSFPGLPADPSDFYEHIDHDERIRLGFDGRRALRRMDGLPTISAPPPITYAAFRAAARVWVEQGGARCEP